MQMATQAPISVDCAEHNSTVILPMKSKSIDFFDSQFRRQVAAGEFALNPFETAARPYISGTVLDLGCGLGNLSILAAREGAKVLAVDASPAAIEHIRAMAAAERLDLQTELADLSDYPCRGRYDTVIAIGILMFLPRLQALNLLQRAMEAVVPGGVIVINVLIEGTTYMDMFDGKNHYLFGRGEIAMRLSGWELLLDREDRFEAPGGTLKLFSTVIARKPG